MDTLDYLSPVREIGLNREDTERRTCPQCTYSDEWRRSPLNENLPPTGECHRHPPQVHHGLTDVWPAVSLAGWCGEFEPPESAVEVLPPTDLRPHKKEQAQTDQRTLSWAAGFWS